MLLHIKEWALQIWLQVISLLKLLIGMCLDWDLLKSNQAPEKERSLKKGIERLEKQILQLINLFISLDQVNIALFKKCKTVDVPAVNSLIIQKALQKYEGFSGMDTEFWVQAWCQDIEELYNKAQVNSIDTSIGDALYVGVFSVNS